MKARRQHANEERPVASLMGNAGWLPLVTKGNGEANGGLARGCAVLNRRPIPPPLCCSPPLRTLLLPVNRAGGGGGRSSCRVQDGAAVCCSNSSRTTLTRSWQEPGCVSEGACTRRSPRRSSIRRAAVPGAARRDASGREWPRRCRGDRDDRDAPRRGTARSGFHGVAGRP